MYDIFSNIKSAVTSPHGAWQFIMRAGLMSLGSVERFRICLCIDLADRRTDEIEKLIFL